MFHVAHRRLLYEVLGAFCLLMMASHATGAAADQSQATERVLGLTGAPNFRDIGGYPTENSRHIRWRAVYRSNALDRLTPEDASRVAALQLASVVDLRTQEERDHAPSVWLDAPADMYLSSKPTLAPLMAEMLQNAQTGQHAREEMEKFYSRMPDLYHDEYGALFHRVAAGKFPILVHCTAGKDRTGVAVAVLLRSVGVPVEVVVRDYELTDKLLPVSVMAKTNAAPTGGAAGALAQLPEESRIALWQSNAEYIYAALNAIDKEYGSVSAYLSRGLGLSEQEISAIRENLTR